MTRNKLDKSPLPAPEIHPAAAEAAPKKPRKASARISDARREKEPASTRDQRAEARRDSILAAALEEFGQRGFGATRLDDVARRAGIAKGTIYLYFRDKDALFRALVTHALEPMLERFNRPIPVEQPTREAVEGFVDAFLTDIYATPRANLVRMVIAEGRYFPDLADFYYNAVVQRGIAALQALLQRGIDREEIARHDLARYPQLVVAPLMMALIWRGLFDTQAPLDARRLIGMQLDLIFETRSDS